MLPHYRSVTHGMYCVLLLEKCNQMLKFKSFDRRSDFVSTNLILSRQKSLMVDRCVDQVTRIRCIVQYIIVVSLRKSFRDMCCSHPSHLKCCFNYCNIWDFVVPCNLSDFTWIVDVNLRVMDGNFLEREWPEATGQCRLRIKQMQQPRYL